MSDDNIIRAFPELPDNPVAIAPRPAGVPHYCQHEAIRVDPHERVVSCAACAQVLDPFDYLHGEALAIRRGWQRHREVMANVRELVDRVDALKREEKRLKAAIKRLGEKAGPVVTVRGRGTL
jgi:hypothetical protein